MDGDFRAGVVQPRSTRKGPAVGARGNGAISRFSRNEHVDSRYDRPFPLNRQTRQARSTCAAPEQVQFERFARVRGRVGWNMGQVQRRPAFRALLQEYHDPFVLEIAWPGRRIQAFSERDADLGEMLPFPDM